MRRVFFARYTLCLDEFENSLNVCGKYGDGSLHLHGVKTIRLSPVIAIDMLEFCILGFYLVPFSCLDLKLRRFLELRLSFLLAGLYRHTIFLRPLLIIGCSFDTSSKPFFHL